MKSVIKCLIEECTEESYSRGLCQNCYQAARNMVRAGQTTWSKLIELGFAKEAHRKFRGTGTFAQALKKCNAIPFPQSLDDGLSDEKPMPEAQEENTSETMPILPWDSKQSGE